MDNKKVKVGTISYNGKDYDVYWEKITLLVWCQDLSDKPNSFINLVCSLSSKL